MKFLPSLRPRQVFTCSSRNDRFEIGHQDPASTVREQCPRFRAGRSSCETRKRRAKGLQIVASLLQSRVSRPGRPRHGTQWRPLLALPGPPVYSVLRSLHDALDGTQLAASEGRTMLFRVIGRIGKPSICWAEHWANGLMDRSASFDPAINKPGPVFISRLLAWNIVLDGLT